MTAGGGYRKAFSKDEERKEQAKGKNNDRNTLPVQKCLYIQMKLQDGR